MKMIIMKNLRTDEERKKDNGPLRLVNLITKTQGQSLLSNGGVGQTLAWVTPDPRLYDSGLQGIFMLLCPHTSASPCSLTFVSAILVLSHIKPR